MALKFSMILEAIDRASAPAKRVQKSIDGLKMSQLGFVRTFRKTRSELDSGGRSMDHFRRRAERLRQVSLGRMFQGAALGARRFGSSLRDLPRRLRMVERAGKAAGRATKWAGGKLLGGLQNGLLAGAAAGGFALFDLFRTAGKFEQFQIQLEGIEGSAGKAKKSMRWVQTFAEKTPFELDQVMEAFVALKAYGIDPMNGSLMALGDGAAGMSKPIMQAVEALADASTGEFERLKEFGIRASKQGDKVVFSYRQNGKDMRREAAMTGAAMEDAITGIFSDRFGGGMERQASTLFGILSNVKDLWSKFLVMVADAGIFEKVKNQLDAWRAKIDAMAKEGSLAQWAQNISDGLSEAWDWGVRFAEQTDWAAVGRGLGAAVTAAAKLVGLLGQAVGKWEQFQARRGARRAEIAENSWFASDEDRAAARSTRQAIEGKYGISTGTGRSEVNGNMRRWKKNDQFGVFGKPRPKPNFKGARNSVDVSGRTVLDVNVRGPATASIRSSRSNNPNVPMTINMGRTMTGAA